jgi:hypothetical protein
MSMTLLKSFSVANDPAEIVWAGSMIPQKRFQCGHWPRWNSNIVDFFRRILGHMQYGFSPWIRALYSYVGLIDKKTRKSRATVPSRKLSFIGHAMGEVHINFPEQFIISLLIS